MEKEGGEVNRQSILDASNNDYWKVCMVAFLKSIDNRTWKAVLKCWKHSLTKDKDGKDTTKLKPKEDWSKEVDLALGNSKALNALFNGGDKNIFRLISNYIVAKKALDIL